jgi:glycosyltransferase involved in cell wall biosynthesis
MLYRFGLKRADCVVAQTQRQQVALRNAFGVKSCVVPMLAEAPTAQGSGWTLESREGGRILWIGRVDPVKRLEWLLEVASRRPRLGFDVVGAANSDSPYARRVLERAESLPNVRVHGRVPESRMPELYARAACLCSTSDIEGFPNTFLEAWSRGVPVVSTFDPDGLIAAQSLGLVAGDISEVVAQLDRILSDSDLWHSASRNARRYYESNHSRETVLSRYEGVLQVALETSGA